MFREDLSYSWIIRKMALQLSAHWNLKQVGIRWLSRFVRRSLVSFRVFLSLSWIGHLTVRDQHVISQVLDVYKIIEFPGRRNGKGQKLAECLVADATASIILLLRDEQGINPIRIFFFPPLSLSLSVSGSQRPKNLDNFFIYLCTSMLPYRT